MSTQHIKMGGAPEGYDAQLVLRELHAHGNPWCILRGTINACPPWPRHWRFSPLMCL